MNEIKIFEHNEFGRIRTVMIDGEVWFVGKDVAEALGYRNINKAIQMHVDEEDKKVLDFRSFSHFGKSLWNENDFSNKIVINESGLYSLVLSSKLSSAKKFKRWITSEVLPSLRKYGVYGDIETLAKIACSPENVIRICTQLIDEQQKNKELTAENKKLHKKCSYLDVITDSKEAVPITVIAKDYGMSGKKMNALLYELNVQYPLKCGTWVLYQKYADKGFTKTKTMVIDKKKKKTAMHTYWTQKGRMFLYEVLKSNGYLPLCEKELPS